MDTPLMKQYNEIKKKYKDAILLYRVGDFYETFGDDAITVSKELNLVLTSRNKDKNEVPMAGIPYHALYPYLSKLLNRGYKVALCEQIENPKFAKGIVKREVTRIFTPGTVLEDDLIVGITNYLFSFYHEKDFVSVFSDISTGEIKIIKSKNKDEILSELYKLNPREILLINVKDDEIEKISKEKYIYLSKIEISFQEAIDIVNKNIKGNLLNEIINENEILISLGGFLKYLESRDKEILKNIREIRISNINDYMFLDDSTVKNLEIFSDYRGEKKNSLYGIIDNCKTKMGSRRLLSLLSFPLIDKDKINERLQAVKEFYESTIIRMEISSILEKLPDIERIWGRIKTGKATKEDLLKLKSFLENIPQIKESLSNFKSDLIKRYYNSINVFEEVKREIEMAIEEDESKGYKIKDGYDEILDNYRKILRDVEKNIRIIENEEIRKTGIRNLRIGYNDIIGYYIEVTKSNIQRVPQHFIRKQTLKNVERYSTRELEDLQYKVLDAKENMSFRENEVFKMLLEKISNYDGIVETSKIIADIDVLLTFAENAAKKNYVMPIVDDSTVIDIKDGRHPVVEEFVNNFVPNDVYLDTENNRFIILTGPNMSGKSTYMRMISHIVIMAQIGSFVPASHARIGIVDRIFTRIGATDDILRGISTFMMEMVELSKILVYSTEKSLIILDEVGRGTGTFDGLAIAWAAAEYIHNKIKARTIFATHYHHLIELEKHLEGVKNYHMPVEKAQDGIVFTRKIKKGGMSESYGIEVASMAGLPQGVVNRAKEILKKIEEENVLDVKRSLKQISLNDIFIKEELRNIDTNKISFDELKRKIDELKKYL
ncbi:MAG: DNA mismatch repair protein MutS [Thermoplasmata archaeon]|jgi:DNA mismatch repair protein MutS